MKNRPPTPGESGGPPKPFAVAILSWFVFPGIGQAALGYKRRAQVWGLVFALLLSLALFPLVGALGALYNAATNLSDLPADMGTRLWPVLTWGSGAGLVWLASGLDAWWLAGRQ